MGPVARRTDIDHAQSTITRQRKLVRDLFIGRTTDTNWKTHNEEMMRTLAMEKSVLIKPLK